MGKDSGINKQQEQTIQWLNENNTLDRKLKTEQHEPNNKPGERRCSRKGNKFLLY